jgi:Sigma-70, region 4
VTPKLIQIAQRWELLSRKAKGTVLVSSKVRDLAKQAGFEWYLSRGDERLGEFLDFDGEGIFRLYSFGTTKITRLCDILETLLSNETEIEFDAEVVADTDFPPMTKARETMEKWNIPVNLPSSLIALPIRVRHYCDENEIATLDALIGEWERLGHSGFIAKKNLGRKSVDELETFIESLVSGDFKLASRFLPLELDGSGVDFEASLTHVLLELSSIELEMLKLRLQDGKTLEESAETFDLTRERVRQVEAKFLAHVSERLYHFRSLHEDMLRAWIDLEDWFALVRWHGDPDHGLLAKAALQSIFQESPQGVARELMGEARMEELEEKLGACPDLWFGGTSLEGFLEGMNTDEQEAFCELLTAGRRFRVDHATGRVHPARTDLRRCIEAMVAEEDDPIPLTWIVELVRKTGYHPTLERGDVLRRRRSWLQREDFPDQMILWKE